MSNTSLEHNIEIELQAIGGWLEHSDLSRESTPGNEDLLELNPYRGAALGDCYPPSPVSPVSEVNYPQVQLTNNIANSIETHLQAIPKEKPLQRYLKDMQYHDRILSLVAGANNDDNNNNNNACQGIVDFIDTHFSDLLAGSSLNSETNSTARDVLPTTNTPLVPDFELFDGLSTDSESKLPDNTSPSLVANEGGDQEAILIEETMVEFRSRKRKASSDLPRVARGLRQRSRKASSGSFGDHNRNG